MICKPCREAADMLTEADAEPFGPRLSIIGMAVMGHRGCHGCDCQHKVTDQVEGKTT